MVDCSSLKTSCVCKQRRQYPVKTTKSTTLIFTTTFSTKVCKRPTTNHHQLETCMPTATQRAHQHRDYPTRDKPQATPTNPKPKLRRSRASTSFSLCGLRLHARRRLHDALRPVPQEAPHVKLASTGPPVLFPPPGPLSPLPTVTVVTVQPCKEKRRRQTKTRPKRLYFLLSCLAYIALPMQTPHEPNQGGPELW